MFEINGLAAGKLLDRLAGAAGPAAVWWLGAVIVWLYHDAPFWPDFDGWRSDQRALAVAAVFTGVLGSALAVQRLAQPALRVAGGDWPRLLRPLRRWRVQLRARQLARDRERWGDLAATLESRGLGAEEHSEYLTLDNRIRRNPASADRLAATQLGNVMVAATDRLYQRYGLDVVKCWPHLWLVLPESARGDLGAARQALDNSMVAVLWGVLFMLFAPLAWWAPLVGGLVAVATFKWWVVTRAESYADLLEATVEVHRTALYRALRLPLPTSPADERQRGMELTHYLWRGSSAPSPVFTDAEASWRP